MLKKQNADSFQGSLCPAAGIRRALPLLSILARSQPELPRKHPLLRPQKSHDVLTSTASMAEMSPASNLLVNDLHKINVC